jgi:hypothetical protein
MTDSITNARTASNSVTNAVQDDRQDGEGSGSLLGLEPTSAENTGQNPVIDEDSNLQPAPEPRLAPLLGTSYSQSIENAGGSSNRRSPEGVCYDKLLRENGPSSVRKSLKTVLTEGRFWPLAGRS